jgi:hypothetical protein
MSDGYTALIRMVYKVKEIDSQHCPELPFMFLNGVCGGTLASNRRDKVYAFLSLTNDSRYLFSPNYNLPVWEVFTQTTNTFIEGSKIVDVLGICSGASGLSEGIPSWVLVWSGKNNSPIYGRIPFMPFCASKFYEHASQRQEDLRQLIVRGSLIDCVNYKIHAFDFPRNELPVKNLLGSLSLDKIFAKLNDPSAVSTYSPSF